MLKTFALAAVAVAIAGCAIGPEVRPAPFRVRPDSVEAGSLEGPFTGKVLDGSSKSPVAGALVYATWSFASGSGLQSPAGYKEHVGSTDAAGRYTIPKLTGVPDGTRVTGFALVIYKRGFVAYRSDRRFSDLGPRLDFAQTDNQIVLDRWRSELSHARHLRYIGGGTAVAALTSWEATDAAAELTAGKGGTELRPGMGEGPYIVAAQLLTEADIKQITKFEGSFETGPLGDVPDNASYSSQHYKAMGRAETFDVALRMWRMDTGKAQEQYEDVLEALPGVDERDEIASRSLRTVEKQINGVAFLDGPRGIVILLTCGSSLCSNADVAVEMGKLIDQRIKQLQPNASAPLPNTQVEPTVPVSPEGEPAPDEGTPQ